MDHVETERLEDELPPENPEDVAVLYSWAKLQGAKYRDFSASRRAFRAQLRHRAAEEQGDAERLAQLEAEAAATAAEHAAREAEDAAHRHELAARQAIESKSHEDAVNEEDASDRAMLAAAELARKASIERIEASRRAEAVATAEAAARREEKELAEARASAQRQARQYEDSDSRNRVAVGRPAVGGEISDPYEGEHIVVRPDRIYHQPATHIDEDMLPARFRSSRDERRVVVTQPGPGGGAPQEFLDTDSLDREADEAAAAKLTRQPEQGSRKSDRDSFVERRSKPRLSTSGAARSFIPNPEAPLSDRTSSESRPERVNSESRGTERYEYRTIERVKEDAPQSAEYQPQLRSDRRAEPVPEFKPDVRSSQAGDRRTRPRPDFSDAPLRTPFVEDDADRSADPLPLRRNETFVERLPDVAAPVRPDLRPIPRQDVPVRSAATDSEQPVPAWIFAPKPEPAVQREPVVSRSPVPTPPLVATTSSVEDTLQHSRERVASRWFALKGVFDQSVEPSQEAPRVSARSPILTVFSLAGGVGKTSLVATLGRALSSVGERVLLTDTTSHGLLPFYFGASELRPGAVRTFTPPEGSSDAPIYLVSYDVHQAGGDAAAQLWLSEELLTGSRGMQRVLVDLGAGLSWAAEQLVRMNSTVLVPVAPDMNSVISLQGVEKFFSGMADAEGKPIRPYYLLNQFDAALPLHLDVREVMRQQLGDRLLPFTIRRSPQVSEALAEGMTVMDYAPEAPVTLDYTNLVSWVRAQAPPASPGFKHARWSER